MPENKRFSRSLPPRYRDVLVDHAQGPLDLNADTAGVLMRLVKQSMLRIDRSTATSIATTFGRTVICEILADEADELSKADLI